MPICIKEQVWSSNIKLRKAENIMTELSTHLRDSLLDVCNKSRGCKFGEDDEAITLSFLYQRPNNKYKHYNLKKIRLKIAMKDSWQAGLLIFEFGTENHNDSSVIGIKSDLENELQSILKTNFYSSVIGGNHILLAWHLSINNKEEADEMIQAVKKIADYIFWKYTRPKRGIFNI